MVIFFHHMLLAMRQTTTWKQTDNNIERNYFNIWSYYGIILKHIYKHRQTQQFEFVNATDEQLRCVVVRQQHLHIQIVAFTV